MNERIKELAEQAWDYAREKFGSFVDDGGEINFTFLHAYDQKFAELIVRECEKSIKSVPTHFEAQDKIIVECLKSIRETFRS